MCVKFDKITGANFKLKDYINHPFFWWPDTLLTYEVDFSGADVGMESALVLKDNVNGAQIPFQLMDKVYDGGRLARAKICFITHLKPNEEKSFTLSRAENALRFDGVKFRRQDGYIIVDNKRFMVKIPDSTAVGGNEPPAPIASINLGGKWLCSNLIYGKGISRIETELLECGDLQFSCKTTYFFGNGGVYTAVVRMTYGYDFVEIDEEARGIAEGCVMQMNWDGFAPTHKYITTWPDMTTGDGDHWETKDGKYGNYEWKRIDENSAIAYYGEDPAFWGPPSRGGFGGEMQVRLGPYAPFFAYSIRPSAAFWDENTGESAGIFVSNHENWNDGEYPIWGAGDKLQGRFYYTDGRLYWKLPICSGTRSVAISCYNRQKDFEWFDRLEKMAEEVQKLGIDRETAVKLTCYPTSYTAFLHNRYAVLNLNKVKDWQLYYDGDFPQIEFEHPSLKTAKELERVILSSGRVVIATKGVEEFHQRPFTFEAVEARMMWKSAADSFLRLRGQLSDESRRRITALLLLTVYVCAQECSIPMKNMLGGHPNFLADVKSTVGLGAFLFPQHKDAKRWADLFEKYIDLNTRYHVRPPEPLWNAEGGRWTESIGIYTWAFLYSTSLVEACLRKYFDGKKRLANPKVELLARFLLNILTPPVRIGQGEELRRAYPPQGAHSSLRPPFRIVELLAQNMEYYNPVLAERLYNVIRENDYHGEEIPPEKDVWSFIYDKKIKPGIPNNFKSAKYTGYGVVLRAGVNTKDEVAVYLQQIDQGLNYRWGMAGEGGCGVLYYYAAGNEYSFNGKEDAGDRRCADTDYCTNFGVWKDGTYKSIGMNELTHHMYNLGTAQYAKLTSRESSDAYSFPEYKSRSVMLIGTDYIVTYDAVMNYGVYTRFSWFVRRDKEFPFIHFVKGVTFDRFGIKGYAYSEHFTAQTKGRWYEGNGDCMAVISHNNHITVENTEFGCKVHCNGGEDYIFNDQRKIKYSSEDVTFEGFVGCARFKPDGTKELAIFSGIGIGNSEVYIGVSNQSIGVSVSYIHIGHIKGRFSSPEPGWVCIKVANPLDGMRFYLDGDRVVSEDGKIQIPAGEHVFEYKTGLPTPLKPEIIRTQGKTVLYTRSPAAERYVLEYSYDGENFVAAKDEKVMDDIKDRVVIRVKGVNAQCEGEYSDLYPMYPQTLPPHCPDGLRYDNGVLSWGEVLGTEEYRLYRRKKGTEEFKLIYSGPEREFADDAEGICEYAVSAVNCKGEGPLSNVIDNDPESTINFHPPGYYGKYVRKSIYNKFPYNPHCDMNEHYPTY